MDSQPMKMNSEPRSDEIPLVKTKPITGLLDTRLEATPYDIIWMEKYRRLEAFQIANGHCRVPTSFENKSLASWVANQRSYQRAGTLRKDREQLLNELGFIWRKPGTNRQEVAAAASSVLWMDRYNQLIAFKERNGHTRVPVKEDQELNRWVYHQRVQYKKGTLREDRRELLEKIGFVWTVRPGPPAVVPVIPAHIFDLNSIQKNEESWGKMFNRLNEYSLKNGHTDAIQANSGDQELVQWVALQRNLRKHGCLEAKHEKALHEIGLSWEPQTADESPNHDRHMSKKDEELWMSQFRLLCEFKKKHGHTTVPRTGETSGLAQWLFVQHRLMERDRLSEDKKKQLAAVCFTESANLGASVTEAPVEVMSGMKARNIQDAPITEASAEVKPGPVSSNMSAGLRHEAPSVEMSVRNSSNSSVAYTRAGPTPLTAPAIQMPVPGSRNSSVATTTASEVAKSSIPMNETSKVDHKFAIGTRIEKVFEVDGVSQAFGGNIVSFEQFEEEDGTLTWGYMIHYDDGDQEHMLEADVAKNVVIVKSKKRAVKSQGKSKTSKRVKLANASGKDALSIAVEGKTTESVPNEANTDVTTKPGPTVQAKDIGRNTTGIAQGPVKSRTGSKIKKAAKEESNSSASRLRDAKLSRPTGEITKHSPNTQSRVTSSRSDKEEEVPTTQPPLNTSAANSSSSEDEPLHLLVRKPVRTGVKNRNEQKEIQQEIIEIDNDEESTASSPSPAPALQSESHPASTPHQKFPKGTLIYRMFFDLSDNGREKSYGGKVIDYVYLNEENDWFYFIRYDDGDTEFMDEWEVAKFSSSIRS